MINNSFHGKLTLYFDGLSPLRKASIDFSRTPDSEAEQKNHDFFGVADCTVNYLVS